MEEWFVPHAASALPPATRVLVLAPHPDDEVFGCGGCTALYAAAGATVRAHILTDGGGQLEGVHRQEVIALRRDESRRAASLLGAGEPSFGSWADRELGAAAVLAEHVGKLIEEMGAEVVFAPSLWEVHPDHRAAAWAAIGAVTALQEAGKAAPVLVFYEVGAPLRPTHLVDISGVMDTKKRAMAAFESQLTQQRYDVHVAALNSFRTYTLGGGQTAAEALIIVRPAELSTWSADYGQSALPGLSHASDAAMKKIDEAVHGLRGTIQDQSAELHERALAIQWLNARVAELERGLEETRQQVEATRHALAEESSLLAATRQALADVLASHSWKVTRPLRWLGERLR